MHKIMKQPDKNTFIDKYEIGLSRLLQQNGKKLYCFFNEELLNNFIAHNQYKILHQTFDVIKNNFALPANYLKLFLLNSFSKRDPNYLYSDKSLMLIKQGFPLLKIGFLAKNTNVNYSILFLWKEIIAQEIGGKASQIEQHYQRIGCKLKNKKSFIIIHYFLLSSACLSKIKSSVINKIIKFFL